MSLDKAIILARNAALVSITLAAVAMLFSLPVAAVIIAQFAFTLSFFRPSVFDALANQENGAKRTPRH